MKEKEAEITKRVYDMTLEEIEAVPHRSSWSENVGYFDSMVILPTAELHESGYRCMDFVACRKGIPICKLSGCSDVVHINGIGGYGADWIEEGTIPKLVPPMNWGIDCLKESGLLQIFCWGSMSCGYAFSSFEIFSHARINEK